MPQSSLRAKAKTAKAKERMARMAREREKARKERLPRKLLPRTQVLWLSLPERRQPLRILMMSDATFLLIIHWELDVFSPLQNVFCGRFYSFRCIAHCTSCCLVVCHGRKRRARSTLYRLLEELFRLC